MCGGVVSAVAAAAVVHDVAWQALPEDNKTHSALMFVNGAGWSATPRVFIGHLDISSRCDSDTALPAGESSAVLLGTTHNLTIACTLIRDDERLATRHRVSVRVDNSAQFVVDGFVPNYCAVDEGAPIDSALCLTQATWTDVESALRHAVSGSFTVAFWVRSVTTASYGNVFAPVGVPFAARFAVGPNVAILDELNVAGAKDEKSLLARSGEPFDDRWHHVAVVFNANAGNVRLFVDGSDASVVYTDAPLGNFSFVPVIGYTRSDILPFPPRALIGDLRVASRALTLLEIDDSQNTTQWTHRWPMRTCTGAQLDADRSQLLANSVHDAYFVCKESVKPQFLDVRFSSLSNGSVALIVEDLRVNNERLTDASIVTVALTAEVLLLQYVEPTHWQCNVVDQKVFGQSRVPMHVVVDGVWSTVVFAGGISTDHCTIDEADPVDSAICLTGLTMTEPLSTVPVVSQHVTVTFWARVFPSHSLFGIPYLFQYPNTMPAFALLLSTSRAWIAHRNYIGYDSEVSVQEYVTAALHDNAPLREWRSYVCIATPTSVSLTIDDQVIVATKTNWPSAFSPRFGAASSNRYSPAARALIANLRIANESMTSAEARARSLPNSTYRWTHSYAMRTCAGDRLTADPDALFGAVRRARFVCKDSVKPRVERAWLYSTANGDVALRLSNVTVGGMTLTMLRARNVSVAFVTGDVGSLTRCVPSPSNGSCDCAPIMESIYAERAKLTVRAIVDGVWSDDIVVRGMTSDHCRLTSADPVDSALCTTALTAVVQPGRPLLSPNPLTVPFTVAFWIKSLDEQVDDRISTATVVSSDDVAFAVVVDLYFSRNRLWVVVAGVATFNVDKHTFDTWQHVVVTVKNDPTSTLVLWINDTPVHRHRIGPESESLTTVQLGIGFGGGIVSTDSPLASRALLADIRIANSESMSAAEARTRSLSNSTYVWSARYYYTLNTCHGATAKPENLFDGRVRHALVLCKSSTTSQRPSSSSSNLPTSTRTALSSTPINAVTPSFLQSNDSSPTVVAVVCIVLVVVAIGAGVLLWLCWMRRRQLSSSSVATGQELDSNRGNKSINDLSTNNNDQYVDLSSIAAVPLRGTNSTSEPHIASTASQRQYGQRPIGKRTDHYISADGVW